MKKPFNAHDPKDVEANNLEIEKKMRQQKEDFQWILSDEKGRRVLWNLLSFCGVFRTSFTGNSETFFKEGHRNVGLKLYHDILTADEEAYLKMRKEAQGESK